MQGLLPGYALVWRMIDMLVSFGVTTLLFALTYKVVPDVRITWKDVGIGATVTAVLFTIGKFLIGLYLGRSGVSSVGSVAKFVDYTIY